MKAGLTLGCLVVIAGIATGVAWYRFTAKYDVRQAAFSGMTAFQTRATEQSKKVDSPAQVATPAPYHFYSPLRDPPPIATPAERSHWFVHLRTLELEGVSPDLAGPPLASVYSVEAAKADAGDAHAATLLFDGLNYCNIETQRSLDDKRQLDQTLNRMWRADTDREGNHTDNLAAALTRTQQLYHYCAGLDARYRTIAHWALIAKKSGDPAILAWTVDYGDDFYQKTQKMSMAAREVYAHKAQKIFRSITENAAEAGVPRAWMYLWVGYQDGGGGYSIDLVRSYASLYTEYMLTKSRALAYQIWEESQCLNPLQLAEGEALANKSYLAIESGRRKSSKSTATSMVWPWDGKHATSKAFGYRFGDCVHAVTLSQLGQ